MILNVAVELDHKLGKILRKIISGLTREEVKILSEDNNLSKLIQFLEKNQNELEKIYSEERKSEKECKCSLKKITAKAEQFTDFSSISESLRTDIERVLSALNKQEMEITKLYFGIECESMKIPFIAKKFGISQKKVRGIRDNAINHMRESKVCTCLLKEYLGK